MKVLNKKLRWPDGFKFYDKLFFTLAFVFAFFFMSHPDLWETANHSYVFLESVFSGNFMNFYEFCAAHNNTYYYINVANYNIMIYILFGLWELPVFIFNQVFSLPLNEQFIIYWAKIVCVAFFVGCGYMVKKLCKGLGFTDSKATMAAVFFLFNPIAFYSPMAMGQYDTLCLFFTLWALCYYIEGDMGRFSLVIGVGMVFKFFPLLILVPLVLLKEKKIFKIVQYGVMSMWLYIPTTALFLGRTGNAAAFTKAMIERMFAVTVDVGMGKPSTYISVYALIVFAAFLWTPKNSRQLNYGAVYISMAVFSLLYVFIYWHPQWLILMIPFIVITTFMQDNPKPWWFMDLIMAAGFFFTCFLYFPNQTGAYLFVGGVASHIGGITVAGENWQYISHFMGLVPYLVQLVPVMFTGSVVGNLIFKLPIGDSSLADRLSDKMAYDNFSDKLFLYGIFIIGFLGFWLAPSLLELINAVGLI